MIKEVRWEKVLILYYLFERWTKIIDNVHPVLRKIRESKNASNEFLFPRVFAWPANECINCNLYHLCLGVSHEEKITTATRTLIKRIHRSSQMPWMRSGIRRDAIPRIRVLSFSANWSSYLFLFHAVRHRDASLVVQSTYCRGCWGRAQFYFLLRSHVTS